MSNTNKNFCKANDFTQEAGDIVRMMMKVMKQIKVKIQIEYIEGHPIKLKVFEDDPIKWLINECNKKEKQVRVQCEQNSRN